jgi:hypothetical protein
MTVEVPTEKTEVKGLYGRRVGPVGIEPTTEGL